MNLRRVLTAKPIDLPIYRQYATEHPKHGATALVYMLPWSVTLGLLCVAALTCWLGGR